MENKENGGVCSQPKGNGAFTHIWNIPLGDFWLAFHMLIIKIVAVVKEGISLNKKFYNDLIWREEDACTSFKKNERLRSFWEQ